MLYNILAVGDVVGGCGVSHLERHLRAVKKLKNIHFTVVNGENAAMVGLTADDAERIFAAVVDSTENPEGLTFADVAVEYNVDKTGVSPIYKSLSESDLTGLVKFGAGDWKIRISWAGSREYKGGSVIVDVTMTDNRLESVVALKEGVSFTYSMDVNVMKQAIFDAVIDWDNSTLPEKASLSMDDFVIQYKARFTSWPVLFWAGIPRWAPGNSRSV